jgi:endo-1,4-beta-xylanase
LPILITEFDYATADEELQADCLRDFLTVAFSHPAIEGVVLWGFWDRYHWRRDAALWREDWSIKPAGRMWMHLVRDVWWTDVAATTDAQDRVAVNGFLGDYTVTAKAGHEIVAHEVALQLGGREIGMVVQPTRQE